MIQTAALTSYSALPLGEKIKHLVDRDIRTLDLYCFLPRDLALIAGSAYSPHEEWLTQLLKRVDPALAAQRIATFIQKLEREKGGTHIDICGCATFLPDISLPDKSPYEGRRTATVRVVERILEFTKALRNCGYACRVLELVAGHTIVSPVSGDRANTICLQYVEPDECFRALEQSLKDISDCIDRIYGPATGRAMAPPPVLAFEIEPGLSKLVGGEKAMMRLASLVKKYPCFGLNWDIGHMIILGSSAEAIRISGIGDQIAHAHISDNANSHYADLCVGSYHDLQVFREWLEMLYACSQEPGSKFQGYISVEMEACADSIEVWKAFNITNDILKKIVIP